MPVLGIVPARLASTRLPQKPLQLLGGKPLILRVVEHILELGLVDHVVVATDAAEIADVIAGSGADVERTRPDHPSGTDRVAEVAAREAYHPFDIILNIQGDEPFLPGEAVAGAVARVQGGFDVGTAAVPLPEEESEDPSRVKVVFAASGRALYFSRAPIPFYRVMPASGPTHWLHLGVYAYARPALARWVEARPTPLELAEGLEQLRALEVGLTIGVATLAGGTALTYSIDTADDLRRAEAHWHATHEAVT